MRLPGRAANPGCRMNGNARSFISAFPRVKYELLQRLSRTYGTPGRLVIVIEDNKNLLRRRVCSYSRLIQTRPALTSGEVAVHPRGFGGSVCVTGIVPTATRKSSAFGLASTNGKGDPTEKLGIDDSATKVDRCASASVRLAIITVVPLAGAMRGLKS